MAKKVYTIKIQQNSHTIEIDKEYNEYEYALVSELFNNIHQELNESNDLSLSIEETDKPMCSIDYETEGITTIKNELNGAIEHTIDNMSPQECRDMFKAFIDSHIKITSSFNEPKCFCQHNQSEENNEMINFSDVISSRLVNQTGPTDGLKLGSL